MNIFEIEVHPSADIYPMIPEDELQQLADDILQNGMLNPIVIDDSNGEPVLIDGRNRLAACKLAGIESDDIEYIEFEGVDVNSFIITSNDKRRHMTKGQRAMAIAMMYPKSDRGKNESQYNDSFNLEGSALTWKNYISQARLVLRTLPLDAAMVLSGELSLNEAYKVAKIERAKGNTSADHMQWLDDNHSELATMVREEQLTLTAAMVEARQRDSNATANRYASAGVMKSFISSADHIVKSCNHKSTINSLMGHKSEYEKNADMSVEEMIVRVRGFESEMKDVITFLEKLK